MIAEKWKYPFKLDVSYKENYILHPDKTVFLSSKIERVDIDIDSNRYISDLIVGDHTIRQIQSTQVIGSESFCDCEFGSNTLFLWEFTEDCTYKRKVDIKYYAFDEILQFIGGIFSSLMFFLSFIHSPYSKVKFIINNSSKKEEISMQIG